MNGVTAIIVTRGDQDLDEVQRSLPEEWELIIWDNSGSVKIYSPIDGFGNADVQVIPIYEDVAVYGRFAALDYASNDLIYVQDDDCVVSDPLMIALAMDALRFADGSLIDAVVCNMPQEFRHDFYDEHALCGFGAAFPRSLPGRTFVWFKDRTIIEPEVFNRTCDIVFTGLTQRILVDHPVRSLPYAHALNRMWKQTDHVGERTKMLQVVKDLAATQEHQMRYAPAPES